MAKSSKTVKVKFGEASLEVRETRRVYLMTHSQVNTLKVSSRKRFADLVFERFNFVMKILSRRLIVVSRRISS